MKRVINNIIKCSALIAILGVVLFYSGFEPIGCALMLVGSFITLIKLINKRNKQKSERGYTTTTYGYFEEDYSSSDCGGA